MPERVRVQHLIVGGSAAGVAAVEAIREFEREVAGRGSVGARGTGVSSIAVVSEEPYPPYARHLISYYLTGEREGDLLAYRPADFWERQGVQLYLGYRVVAVDTGARTARLRRITRPSALPVGLPGGAVGEAAAVEVEEEKAEVAAEGEAKDAAEAEVVLQYETLLLATGGRPIRPPLADPGVPAGGDECRPAGAARVSGGDGEIGETQQELAPGVTFFTTLDDAIRVRRAVARGARRAVVVGGGLIGLQVAEALVRLGVEVAIVELMPRLLGPVLDEEAAARVETLARRAGVGVWTGVSVTAIERDGAGRLTGVVLADGRHLAADLLILAAGVRPRLELARAAGLLCDRGVVLVRGAETSVPGVYAAGDVAQGWDMAAGVLRPLPIWSNAVLQGRMAGRQMAARVLGIDPVDTFASAAAPAAPAASLAPAFTPGPLRDELRAAPPEPAPAPAAGQAAAQTAARARATASAGSTCGETTGSGGSAQSSGGPEDAGSSYQARPFAGLMLNAAHFFGLSVVSAGVPNPPAGDRRFTVVAWQAELTKQAGWQATPDRSGVMQMLARSGWDYRKLVFQDGRLVGLLAAGPSVAGAGAMAGLIRRRVRLDAGTTGEALVRKWDWSVLPRTLRQELLWETVSEGGVGRADGNAG